MLYKVKLALRINHNLLDSDIEDTINAARSEMMRAGVAEEVASGSSDLVEMAIKTYCLFTYANEKVRDGYFESWQYQLDCIRKSTISEVVESV